MANQTKIEWVRNEDGSPGYTINPVKGLCPVACSYCYGRRLYQRFKWDPEIRYEDPFWQFHALKKKQPSRVFIGSTMELFGPWIRPEWMHSIISFCKAYPQHTFIFLTKKPENLPKKWPDNCWVGVTATSNAELRIGMQFMNEIDTKVRFVSLEPLLWWNDGAVWDPENVSLTRWLKDLNWLIIGQQTPVRESTTPKLGWIQEIVQAADRAGVPVFLKDNLKGLLPEAHPFYTFPWESDPEAGASVLRQEFPKVKAHAQ